jgi:hypothetical protein
MSNPGATGKFYWTKANPKGPASEPVELVAPDGTLAGITLRTLETAWGQFCERSRADIEKRIISLLNEGKE